MSFPHPPDDLGIGPDVMSLIDEGLRSGDFQIFQLTCEKCGYTLRRVEKKGGGGTVYCPKDENGTWAMKRTISE